MTDPQSPNRWTPELEERFVESRRTALVEANPNTFWSVALVLLAFSAWDYFADRDHWRAALAIRATAAIAIIATGLFQKLPGKLVWMPFLAKVRLVIAVVASAYAAAMLDRGYGFGVAGLIVVMLIGPYVAVDAKDLRRTNLAAILALVPVMFLMPLSRFDIIGTAVFVMLAAAVSMLLGRALESSNRRAFLLELSLQHDARTDALTGLLNRRAMQEHGRAELKKAARSGEPVSVILCDLDHFKSINDKYGHETGDRALTSAAAVLKQALRESDPLGRWGGEEFLVILPATNQRGAADVAERMRAAMAAAQFDGVAETNTISLGVASLETFWNPAVETPEDEAIETLADDQPMEILPDTAVEWDLLIKEADQPLYRAKREGRNRVVASQ